MQSKINRMIYIAVFAGLTAAGSIMRIPFPLVPLTLQTFFVYLAGNILRARDAAISQIIFLLTGLSGIPVFSMGGGPGYIMKPTFGYLLAFPVAAWMAGYVSGRSSKKNGYLIGNLYAAIIIFFIGSVYFYILSNYFLDMSISVKTVLISGVVIFIPGEILKIISAAMLAKKLNKVLGSQSL